MLVAELDRNRTIGVEHELYCPIVGGSGIADVQSMIAETLCANGVTAIRRNYSSAPLPAGADIAVEGDSSIRGTSEYRGVRYAPIEIKTRVMDCDTWEQVVPTVLRLVRHLGGRVNNTCGHHVHIGLPEVQERPAVIRSAYNLFHRYEPVILGGLVPPSRRENGYCCRMPDRIKLFHGCRSVRAYRKALEDWHRYCGLNLTPLAGASPNLEIRYASGTLDPEKARHWLRFCLQMVGHAVARSCQAGKQLVCGKKEFLNLLTTCGFRANSRIYSKVSAELRETGRYLLLKRFRKFFRQVDPSVCQDC